MDTLLQLPPLACMDVSTEFNQRACFLVACDPSSTRPRNKTLTTVVHVLPDDFFGILSLVRLLPHFFVISLSFIALVMLVR